MPTNPRNPVTVTRDIDQLITGEDLAALEAELRGEVEAAGGDPRGAWARVVGGDDGPTLVVSDGPDPLA